MSANAVGKASNTAVNGDLVVVVSAELVRRVCDAVRARGCSPKPPKHVGRVLSDCLVTAMEARWLAGDHALRAEVELPGDLGEVLGSVLVRVMPGTGNAQTLLVAQAANSQTVKNAS